jgi:hypothetical protein
MAAQLATAGMMEFAARLLKRVGQQYVDLFNTLATQQQTCSQLPHKHDHDLHYQTPSFNRN